MATTAANGRRQVQESNGPKYAITIKVTKDLKDRIEQFAGTYNLSVADATRTLLAFAVTEAEDPKTRMLYATYCSVNAKLHKMLQESLRSGVDSMHDWLLQNVGRFMDGTEH